PRHQHQNRRSLKAPEAKEAPVTRSLQSFPHSLASRGFLLCSSFSEPGWSAAKIRGRSKRGTNPGLRCAPSGLRSRRSCFVQIAPQLMYPDKPMVTL
ncbi:hypothetical protein, partial [Bradyrhizobium sp. Leaf396]|uniref:hypothetical protein n=1 Tax=Bradyrhizobium sp. Leaf396 TaxID=1736363 RepID=UPI001AEC93E3